MSNLSNLAKEIRKAAKIELARRHVRYFTDYTYNNFGWSEFHKVYYEVLDRFAKGEIKKLMITVPPQHGKSEGSTRRLPAYMLGVNPDLRIAVSSYNSTFASKFNRDIQRIIDTPEYNDVFKDTLLSGSIKQSSQFLRNSTEFEIVNKKGSLKSVGRGGALTGNPVDVMIMDDLYKDFAEGNSPIIRDSVWDWYTTVVKTRLHNDSQELIVFTRWHEDDLIGRLEKKENVITVSNWDDLKDLKSSTWVKINFEALKTSEATEIDNRERNEPLWKEKHSREKLEETKALDEQKFQCLYQGNPRSAEGLLYKPFKTYSTLPDLKIIKNYTDTADKGKDYTCSIVYGVGFDKKYYILDLLVH